MTAFIAACLWGIATNILAVLPSRDTYWTRAYLLIALGVPILIWVFYENGPRVALAVLVAGASMLRWPVRYLWRWIRRQVGR